ncbi:MAG: hypothetical protein ACTJGR_06450, partial [Pauljensenia sp.]
MTRRRLGEVSGGGVLPRWQEPGLLGFEEDLLNSSDSMRASSRRSFAISMTWWEFSAMVETNS